MTVQSGSAAQNFPAKTYKNDGGMTGSGLLSLASAMVVAGGIMGYIAHLVAPHFWLVALFPIAIGFVLGGIGMWCIGKGRIRNPLIGGALGFLGGVLAMTVMHHFDYESFKATREAMFERGDVPRQITPEQRTEAMQDTDDPDALRSLFEVLDVDSFVSYLNLEAKEGFSIGSSSSSTDRGIKLTGTAVWIYWVIELIIVAAVAYGMTRMRAGRPYSLVTDDWKKPLWLGSFPIEQLPHVQTALREGDVGRLKTLSPSEAAGPVLLTAYVAGGREIEDSVDLELEAFKDEKTKKTVAMYTYPPEALAALRDVFVPPPAVTPLDSLAGTV